MGKVFLIEVFIWNFFILEVFSGNGMFWVGKVFEYVKFLFCEFENDIVFLVDFYRWNVYIVLMLFFMYDLDKRCI